MRTLYYTVLLTLFSITSLSAQSLYQDALSLAEILKNKQAGNQGQLTSNPPKLVAMKERTGIRYLFAQNPIDYKGGDFAIKGGTHYWITGTSSNAQIFLEQENERILLHSFNGRDLKFLVFRAREMGNIGYSSFLDYTTYKTHSVEGIRANAKITFSDAEPEEVQIYNFGFRNREKEEVRKNELSLQEIGNYFLTGFAVHDTIDLAIHKDYKTHLFFENEQTLIVDHNGIQKKIPFEGLIKIVNQFDEVRIAGTYVPSDEIALAIDFSDIKKGNLVNRKLHLKPQNWYKIEAPLYGQINGRQYRMSFKNGERMLDSLPYVLKGEAWKNYIAWVEQGSDVLFEDVNAFVDSFQIRYIADQGEVAFDYAFRNEKIRYVSERYFIPYFNEGNLDRILSRKARIQHTPDGNWIYDYDDTMNKQYQQILQDMAIQLHGFLIIDPQEVSNIRGLDLKELTQRSEFYAFQDDNYKIYEQDAFVPKAAEPFSSDYFEHPIVTLAKNKKIRIDIPPRPLGFEDRAEAFKGKVLVFVMTDANANRKLVIVKPNEENAILGMPSHLEINTFDRYLVFKYNAPFEQHQEVKKTRDVQNIPTILGTHNNFQKDRLRSRNLVGGIADSYRQNPILRSSLDDYLQRNQFCTIQEDIALRAQIGKSYRLYYPWQNVLYEEEELTLNNKVSYQDLIASYRRPIPTASDKLQEASQELAGGQKKLSGGLNASTIAAGLSDFVVERAQEELNINFLDRMRNNILSDSSEFKTLFPNTHDMFRDFQVVHYRTLLEFAKTSFVADLQDLGLNFPRLFELEKYRKLKDDPSVYNIFLVYDLANKIYEDTPVDSVLLHLYSRLNDRQHNLDDNINRDLSRVLLNQGKEKQLELMTAVQRIFEELNQFDFDLQMEVDTIYDVLSKERRTAIQKSEVETLMGQFINNIKTQYDVNKQREIYADFSAYGYGSSIAQLPTSSAQIDGTKVKSKERDKYWLLLEDELNPNVRLKRYEYLISKYLKGDPFYEYTLATLPYEQFEEYYEKAPADSIIVSSGLGLLKEFLEGDQLKIRQRWLDIFAKGVEEALEREEQLAIEKSKQKAKYPEQIKILLLLHQHRQEILDFVELYIVKIEEISKNSKEGKHQIEALRYLQQQLNDIPARNQLIDWEKVNRTVNLFDYRYFQTFTSTQAQGRNMPEDFNENFFRQIAPNTTPLLYESTTTSAEILKKLVARLKKIHQEYENLNVNYEAYELLTYKLYSTIENTQGIEDDYPNYYSPSSKVNTYYVKNRRKRYFADVAYLEELLELMTQTNHLGNNERYFQQIAKKKEDKQTRLDVIKSQFDSLEQHLAELEQEVASKTYKTRQHAKDFSTLTETAIHLFNAFRSGSIEIDSIIRLDTLVQTVRLMKEGQEITYDSISIVPKNIAAGRGVRKWITKPQFEQLMDDPIAKDAFLGLLYQRLKTINPNVNFTPEGLALTSTKLINTIYELDELRANVRYQKLQGKQLNFQDYYPFIRTTVDMLNILLTTPIGTQSLDQQFPALADVPKISDQSLSLFENIFAENYGEAIRNVVNLLTIIWEVDVANAAAEMKAIQAAPLQAQKSTGLRELEKQNKKKATKNDKLKKAMVVYGTFMANIVAAQNADQVKGAIKAVAVPPGSSSVKRTAKFNVAVNGYFGGGFYRETLTNPQIQQNAQSGSVGLAVPVGITASLGGLGKNGNWSYSLFVPVLDIGAVTAYRIDQQNAGANGNLPELTFGNLIAPGGYFIVNIPKSPFSFSAGAQFGPQARKITINGADLTSSAWRYGVTATIDVPIFNLFNR